MEPAAEKRGPRLGLALGGGGVRGLAHLGVLAVLEEAGLPVHAIAGSSMGAIVGAAYALNPPGSLASLRQQVSELGAMLASRLRFVEEALPAFLQPVRQFIQAERFLLDNLSGWGVFPESLVVEPLQKLTLHKALEEGRLSLAVVAVDLISGERVIFRHGPAVPALQASAAVPGFFPPVAQGERLLADGAIVDVVPVDVVRDMGVEVVVAVDVDQETLRGTVRNGLDAFLRAFEICSRHHKRLRLALADLVLRPQFEKPLHMFDFAHTEACIRAGEEAARRALPTLRALLGT
ncbi:MAG: esterase [Candidatus Tectimicrobiota bacterium]|nr:MAG: esterase [Candidatus Tectomicrobia bacterium]